MKSYEITTTTKTFKFVGKHLPERERPNWHYYETEDGAILHFRKEHMVLVQEQKPIEPFNRKQESIEDLLR